MSNTRIRVSPEMQSRLARGHNQFGEPVPHWEIAVLEGAGALRSTANDLLKYVAAHAGLTSSSLTPLMKDTRDQSLAWYTQDFRRGKIVGHSGGTAGCSAYVGLDESAGRGVVVLSNRKRVIDVEAFGTFLLKSAWRSLTTIPEQAINVPLPAKPRVAIELSLALLDAWVGEYEFAPDALAQLPQGMKARVWRVGNQLLCEARGKNVLQGRFEIYPESETVFFDRISATRSIFRKNRQGIVTSLVLSAEGLPDAEGNVILAD
jgi:serine-type D-Ala-D-Ala carboxypeptidase/endopeptidase